MLGVYQIGFGKSVKIRNQNYARSTKVNVHEEKFVHFPDVSFGGNTEKMPVANGKRKSPVCGGTL
jgi:hypothetical protein